MKRILLIAALAVLMMGCHNSKNTKTNIDEVKKAEATLFNSDMTINPEAVPDAIATFTKYVDDNPEAVDAPEVLFKAVEIAVNTKQAPQQGIDLVNKLVTDYPKFDKNPVALFMLASFIYEERLGDLDKARETYQQIIDNYPDSPFAGDAALSIEHLGMTPEELIRMFEEAEN